ncbi:CAP domain-containing protein [Streptomyces sp. NPDC029006]|uniref:RCC1 domain-containing protein n=1 Tax=Streptomyces sp. NPDC029006 TaxID=3155467 RepID=UPI0033E29FEE
MPCPDVGTPASTLPHTNGDTGYVEAVEAAILCRVNEVRQENGVGPLTLNLKLRNAARDQALAASMIKWWDGGGSKIHTNPVTGSTPTSRIKDAGYCPAEASPRVTENGRDSWFSPGSPVADQGDTTAEAAVGWWMGSPPHAANILNPAFKESGVAVFRGTATQEHAQEDGYIYVQTFGGCSQVDTPELGVVKGWGRNLDGQVGDNTVTNRPTPVEVFGLTGVIAVSGGDRHSLALTSDGRVWAWGANNSGQLGDGTTAKKAVPTVVGGLPSVRAVAAGGFHSLALDHDGVVFTWGDNTWGQLGDGTNVNRSKPQSLDQSTAKYIAAGTGHSLAINSDDVVMAWGDNARGQLGDGTTISRTRSVQAVGITDVIAVDGGYFHTLALKQDGSLWAWGSNGAGQLGDHTLKDRTTPVQVAAPSYSSFKAIAAGGAHSLALEQNGWVWTWGININGQLGTGDSSAPYSWVPKSALDQYHVVSIAAGNAHNLAAKEDGSVWAWGNNSYGQLGNNGNTHSWVPILTDKIKNMNTVGAGGQHSLAFFH